MDPKDHKQSVQKISRSIMSKNKIQLSTEEETLLWLMTYLMPENIEEIFVESQVKDNELIIHVIITYTMQLKMYESNMCTRTQKTCHPNPF